MEWFTAQAPGAASLEPIWTRLAASLIPVRAVEVSADPARVADTLEGIRNDGEGGRFPQGGGGGGGGDSGGEKREGGGSEGRVGGRAMSLAQYVAELSAFDVVISANSLDDVQTKVGTQQRMEKKNADVWWKTIALTYLFCYIPGMCVFYVRGGGLRDQDGYYGGSYHSN